MEICNLLMPVCFIYSALKPIKVALKTNTSMLLDVYLIYGTLGCQVIKSRFSIKQSAESTIGHDLRIFDPKIKII